MSLSSSSNDPRLFHFGEIFSITKVCLFCFGVIHMLVVFGEDIVYNFYGAFRNYIFCDDEINIVSVFNTQRQLMLTEGIIMIDWSQNVIDSC